MASKLSKRKKKPLSGSLTKSIHTDILKDIPKLIKGDYESLGREIPEDANSNRFRSSLMLFVNRNCTPPEGKRFASVVLDRTVWIQLEDV